jgi:hypothetical protein
MPGNPWQSLLSPQSRLIVTSSSDNPSADTSLNSDAITVEVPVDDVRVGDSILVLPGETIPVDVRSHYIVSFFLIASIIDQSINPSETHFCRVMLLKDQVLLTNQCLLESPCL